MFFGSTSLLLVIYSYRMISNLIFFMVILVHKFLKVLLNVLYFIMVFFVWCSGVLLLVVSWLWLYYYSVDTSIFAGVFNCPVENFTSILELLLGWDSLDSWNQGFGYIITEVLNYPFNAATYSSTATSAFWSIIELALNIIVIRNILYIIHWLVWFICSLLLFILCLFIPNYINNAVNLIDLSCAATYNSFTFYRTNISFINLSIYLFRNCFEALIVLFCWFLLLVVSLFKESFWTSYINKLFSLFSDWELLVYFLFAFIWVKVFYYIILSLENERLDFLSRFNNLSYFNILLNIAVCINFYLILHFIYLAYYLFI